MFSSEGFLDFTLALRALIYFELILIYDVRFASIFRRQSLSFVDEVERSKRMEDDLRILAGIAG